LTSLRRDLHAHPELSFEEFRTSDLIADTLSGWGIPIHRGIGTTGVVGIIEGKSRGRSIGLRADMDALPIQELNTFAHASQTPGKMHACGHDGHMSMLLGAAQYLADHRDFSGVVYLIFQPAEEFGGGANKMIQDGLFDTFPIDAVFGMHNWPGTDVGKFRLSPGPVMASSNNFKVTIGGKGSHAAMPHMGIDPVPIACQMVQMFQNIISRNKKPLDAAVISVTIIQAGNATNVLPDNCELQGTVRAFRQDVLDLIEKRMQEVAEHACSAFGATCQFEFRRDYPATFNHPDETALAKKAIASVVAPQNLLELEPTMGSEDFAYMLQVKPGCYCFIGNGDGSHRDAGHGPGPCSVHNSSYDFNDALLPIGATYWVRLAETYLGAEASPA
jgi:hippurate hydrolase